MTGEVGQTMSSQAPMREVPLPELVGALIWLATAEGVPAMEQIEAAILVLDAAEASDEEWPEIEQEILRLLGSKARH